MLYYKDLSGYDPVLRTYHFNKSFRELLRDERLAAASDYPLSGNSRHSEGQQRLYPGLREALHRQALMEPRARHPVNLRTDQ